MAGKGYSMQEKRDLLQFIIEKNAYSETKGRSLWMDYANSGKTTRTWQSLKETFLKRILPDIRNPYYNVTPDILQNFRSNAYRSDEKHSTRRAVKWTLSKENAEGLPVDAVNSKDSSADPIRLNGDDGDSVGENGQARVANGVRAKENDVSSFLVLDWMSDRSSPSGHNVVAPGSPSPKLTPAEQAMPPSDDGAAIHNNGANLSDLSDVIDFMSQAFRGAERSVSPPDLLVPRDNIASTSEDLIRVLSDETEIVPASATGARYSGDSDVFPPNQITRAEIELDISKSRKATSRNVAKQKLLNVINKQTRSLSADDTELCPKPRSAHNSEEDSSISGILDHVLESEMLQKQMKKRAPRNKRTVEETNKRPIRTKKEIDAESQVSNTGRVDNSEPKLKQTVSPSKSRQKASPGKSQPRKRTVSARKAGSKSHRASASPRRLVGKNRISVGVQVGADETAAGNESLARSNVAKAGGLGNPVGPAASDNARRRRDLDNLFGFSSGRVKVNEDANSSPRKVRTERSSAFRLNGRRHSSEDSDRLRRHRYDRRRGTPSEATSSEESDGRGEGNLLAVYGGCFYPVYGGLPGSTRMRVIKWIPKRASRPHRHRRAQMITISDSESDSYDRRKRRHWTKLSQRQKDSVSGKSPTSEVVDFPNVDTEKAYCIAVLRYHKSGSKGPPPRIQDYQRSLTKEEIYMKNKRNRTQEVTYISSESDVASDVRHVPNVSKPEKTTADVSVEPEFFEKGINGTSGSPASEDDFWKVIYQMLHRKMGKEKRTDKREDVDDNINRAAVQSADSKTEAVAKAGAPETPVVAVAARDSSIGVAGHQAEPSSAKGKEVQLKPRKCRSSSTKKSPVRGRKSKSARSTPSIIELDGDNCQYFDGDKGSNETTTLGHSPHTNQESTSKASCSANNKTDDAKKPKYSVTVQKYGENLANYVIENTQQTELILDVMNNFKERLTTTIENAPTIADREKENKLPEGEAKTRKASVDSIADELVHLDSSRETTPAARSLVHEKERLIFDEIRRCGDDIILTEERLDALQAMSASLMADADDPVAFEEDGELVNIITPSVTPTTDCFVGYSQNGKGNHIEVIENSSEKLSTERRRSPRKSVPKKSPAKPSSRSTRSTKALNATMSDIVIVDSAIDSVITVQSEDAIVVNPSDELRTEVSDDVVDGNRTPDHARADNAAAAAGPSREHEEADLAQATEDARTDAVSPVLHTSIKYNESSEKNPIIDSSMEETPLSGQSPPKRARKRTKRPSESGARNASQHSREDEPPRSLRSSQANAYGPAPQGRGALARTRTRSAVRAEAAATGKSLRSTRRTDQDPESAASPADSDAAEEPLMREFRPCAGLKHQSFQDRFERALELVSDGRRSVVYGPAPEIRVSHAAVGDASPPSYLSETGSSVRSHDCYGCYYDNSCAESCFVSVRRGGSRRSSPNPFECLDQSEPELTDDSSPPSGDFCVNFAIETLEEIYSNEDNKIDRTNIEPNLQKRSGLKDPARRGRSASEPTEPLKKRVSFQLPKRNKKKLDKKSSREDPAADEKIKESLTVGDEAVSPDRLVKMEIVHNASDEASYVKSKPKKSTDDKYDRLMEFSSDIRSMVYNAALFLSYEENIKPAPDKHSDKIDYNDNNLTLPVENNLENAVITKEHAPDGPNADLEQDLDETLLLPSKNDLSAPALDGSSLIDAQRFAEDLVGELVSPLSLNSTVVLNLEADSRSSPASFRGGSEPDHLDDDDFFTATGSSPVEYLSPKSTPSEYFSPEKAAVAEVEYTQKAPVKQAPQSLKQSLFGKVSKWHLFSTDSEDSSPANPIKTEPDNATAEGIISDDGRDPSSPSK